MAKKKFSMPIKHANISLNSTTKTISMTKNKDRTQITPQLEKRIEKLKKKARDYIAKTEIIQFRLDENTYCELFSLAEHQRKPIGTLVREWITDKVKQELANQ